MRDFNRPADPGAAAKQPPSQAAGTEPAVLDRSMLYAAIYSANEIYRPPSEDNSTLLEVAAGCSWAKCTFCDFIRDEFKTWPEQEIEFRLKILSRLEPRSQRVFFLGQNAFCLSAEKLLALMKLTRRYLPSVREFSMYARADDVLRKTPEELASMRRAGLADLHIGIESGSDPILCMVNKGCTSFEIRDALCRLDKSGVGYYLTIILGLGGKAYRNMHGVETARLLNLTHPKQIWALALKLWPGTPLAKQAERGEFQAIERMLAL